MNAEEEVRFREAIASLMLETRRDLNNLRLIPRTGDSDIALLALLSKSIVVTEAIVSLVANGFEDEAYGLCRTAVDIELTIRYLTNKDTPARCGRYVNFFAKDKTEWDRLIGKYYPGMMITKRGRAEDLERLAAAYRNPHRWSECPDGLKGFAAEPDAHEARPDGSPLEENFCYDVIYKWMSFYVHSTVSGIEDEHLLSAGETFKVHPGKGRSRHGKSALRTSMLCVHLNLLRVLRTLNMEYPERLSARYEDIVKEFLPSRES